MSDNDGKGLQRAVGASYSVLGALGLFGIGGYWLDKYRESETNTNISLYTTPTSCYSDR